ncbi:MAG: hypothetical protein JWQ01_4826 [Massilia sp.]|nr:hypothetical protein [Massilia sp.]
MSIAERNAIATASLYADAQYVSRYPALSTAEERAEFAKLVEALAGGVA